MRSTFDAASSLYDEVRPGYPEELFEDVVSLSGVPPGGRILEVGCGTGQATLPLAHRGYEILCVELGENLAATARRNLAAYPRVEVRTGDFEATPLPEGSFDLLISATAFHWLDPAVAYLNAARSLRPGGAIALFWNEHVSTDADEGFFAAAQEVYEREAPEIFDGEYGGPPRPEECRTGARRSSAQGFSVPSSGAPTSERRPTMPGATSVYWIRTRGTSPSGRRPGRASTPASRA